MSGTLLVNLASLRINIAAEYERLGKRPIPARGFDPWAMPLDLDDLLAFIEVVERAKELSRFLGPGGDPDLRNRVARLDVALEAFDFTEGT